MQHRRLGALGRVDASEDVNVMVKRATTQRAERIKDARDRNVTQLDLVSITIHAMQGLVILAGPLLAFRMARAKYTSLVASVILEHRNCPHCGYNIQELPSDSADGASVRPECGCVWGLNDTRSVAVRIMTE